MITCTAAAVYGPPASKSTALLFGRPRASNLCTEQAGHGARALFRVYRLLCRHLWLSLYDKRSKMSEISYRLAQPGDEIQLADLHFLAFKDSVGYTFPFPKFLEYKSYFVAADQKRYADHIARQEAFLACDGEKIVGCAMWRLPVMERRNMVWIRSMTGQMGVGCLSDLFGQS